MAGTRAFCGCYYCDCTGTIAVQGFWGCMASGRETGRTGCLRCRPGTAAPDEPHSDSIRFCYRAAFAAEVRKSENSCQAQILKLQHAAACCSSECGLVRSHFCSPNLRRSRAVPQQPPRRPSATSGRSRAGSFGLWGALGFRFRCALAQICGCWSLRLPPAVRRPGPGLALLWPAACCCPRYRRYPLCHESETDVSRLHWRGLPSKFLALHPVCHGVRPGSPFPDPRHFKHSLCRLGRGPGQPVEAKESLLGTGSDVKLQFSWSCLG